MERDFRGLSLSLSLSAILLLLLSSLSSLRYSMSARFASMALTAAVAVAVALEVALRSKFVVSLSVRFKSARTACALPRTQLTWYSRSFRNKASGMRSPLLVTMLAPQIEHFKHAAWYRFPFAASIVSFPFSVPAAKSEDEGEAVKGTLQTGHVSGALGLGLGLGLGLVAWSCVLVDGAGNGEGYFSRDSLL